jgi:hypothetical protein
VRPRPRAAPLGPPLVATLAAASCGGGPPPTEAECLALLDRYVAHALHREGAKPSAGTVADAQAAARERALRSPGFQRCPRDLERRDLECALKAYTADEIERCLVPVP